MTLWCAGCSPRSSALKPICNFGSKHLTSLQANWSQHSTHPYVSSHIADSKSTSPVLVEFMHPIYFLFHVQSDLFLFTREDGQQFQSDYLFHYIRFRDTSQVSLSLLPHFISWLPPFHFFATAVHLLTSSAYTSIYYYVCAPVSTFPKMPSKIIMVQNVDILIGVWFLMPSI